jgi:hypothetical protein
MGDGWDKEPQPLTAKTLAFYEMLHRASTVISGTDVNIRMG